LGENLEMRANPTITATEMRGINRSAVLETIRRQGPVARTAIAEALQVSLPTVMRIVDELIAEDLVVPTGAKEWSGGRKRPLLEFNANGHLIIGVDMNETRLYGAVANLAGEILSETSLLHSTRGVESYDFLVSVIEELLRVAAATGKKIRGIGVGVPGITYYEKGVVQWAPTLEWRNFPLKESLHERFGLPVVLDNDVNIAALGEMWFGAGQKCNNLVLVMVGNGIGAGVIIDGGVYRGSHLTAGEIGFLLPDRSHLGAPRSGYGALESLASGASIAGRARQALAARQGEIDGGEQGGSDGGEQGGSDGGEQGGSDGGEQGGSETRPYSTRPHGEFPTAEDVFEAYRRGEEWARPIISDTIDYLAQMVATLAVCFDPDMIVLSGGVAKSADLLVEPIYRRIEGVIPIRPRLEVSTLGHRAAIMGAIIEILYNTADFYVVRKQS
jgi:glucokinase